ncbi:MAG: DUF4837 family protein [Flavicella sp.]
MKQILLFGSLLIVLLACETKKEAPVFVESNGRMNHLLLVVENSDWATEVGDTLKSIIKTPVLGMPQAENQFDVSQVAYHAFGKMFKASRNVLIVQKDTVNAFVAKRNVFARPQQIVRVTGTNQAALIMMLSKNREKLIKTFKDFDFENLQRTHRKNSYASESFETLKKLGIELSIPKIFKKVDDTGDFLWLRQHLSGGIAKGDGSSNILVYSVPMPSKSEDSVQTISQMRDTIGKKYIPGREPHMFMITEKAFTPIVQKTTMQGRPTYATFGKWEVLHDFMAGPFLNFAIEDSANNRWIVMEAFVYAPSVDKRDYMFEVEAVLRTLKIK